MQDEIEKHVQTALPFEDLIAGPINALIMAQSYSAHATYQYMISLMDNSEGDVLSPKTLEIMTSKMIQASCDDKENSTNSDVIEKKQLLNIPLLSLLPVPYISINEAEINFNANIIHHETQKDNTNYKISKDGKKIPFFTTVPKMHAVFASNNKRTSDIKSHINVKIKVKQQELPLGLEKYLQVLGNSITIKDVK